MKLMTKDEFKEALKNAGAVSDKLDADVEEKPKSRPGRPKKIEIKDKAMSAQPKLIEAKKEAKPKPKRKPKAKPKTKDAPKEPVAAGQEEATKQEFSEKDAIKMLKSKMDGHTDTSYEWAETARMSIKALEKESCEDAITLKDALKGLVEIADRWINGRKVDADRYKKISEDIDAQVKQYQRYIETVKEMI